MIRPISLHEALQAWINARPDVSTSGVRTARYNVKRWIKLDGERDVTRISAESFTRFRQRAIALGYSSRSIESTVEVVARIARHAGCEIDTGNRLKSSPPAPRVPSPQTIGAIYSAAKHATWPCQRGGGRGHTRPPSPWLPCSRADWWRAWIVTAAWTGLRLADLQSLTWEDLESGRAANKTGKRHPIVIPEFVRRHLAKLDTSTDAVFVRMPAKQVRDELQRLATATNVPYVSPQGFRRFAVQQWTQANPLAGGIVHGTSLGVRAYYLDPARILEDTAPSVVMPEEFRTVKERNMRVRVEEELIRRLRKMAPKDRQLAVDLVRKIG